MAILDHEAIRRAYPDAVTIDDSFGVFDKEETFVFSDLKSFVYNY